MISKLHSIAIILVSVFTEFPTTLLLLPVAIVLSDVFASIVRRFTARSGHSEMSIKAAKARQLRDNKRNARGEKFLTKLPSEKQREEILNMTAEQVIAAIKNKKFSCEAILQTFIAQAQKCAKEFNAVTEEPFEEALEAARAVDAKVARGDPLRPLEGLPISVKDCVEQRNCLATCGLASKADVVLKDDGLLVKLLRDAGAIPFVRGNIPQALMLPESDNYVWGRTSNVWNKDRSPGGSSGGDAALVAFRAAPIGIGGDIGGSLRIPASFTGITTLKATPLRVTRSGSHMPRHDPYGSQPSVRAVAGPLTRRVDDLKLIFEHAWWTESAFKGDSTSVPMPFDHKQYNSTKQLTVGYYDDDEYFTPVPACRRAVQEAAEAFKAAGHIVKRFDPVRVREAVMCFYGIMSADGHMAGFYNGLQGEKLLYIYESLATMAFIPAYLRPILAALLKAIGEIRASDLISIAGAKSANEFWHIVSTQTKLVEATLRAMDDANVDVLLTPTTATPAFLHGASKDLTPSVSYTMLWNLLHFPSGVVPTTLVRKDETDPKKYLDSLPVNQRDRYAKHAATQCENSEGLPVGVQIVARPFQDETVLRAMKVLESQLDQQRNGPFPCAPAALK